MTNIQKELLRLLHKVDEKYSNVLQAQIYCSYMLNITPKELLFKLIKEDISEEAFDLIYIILNNTSFKKTKMIKYNYKDLKNEFVLKNVIE